VSVVLPAVDVQLDHGGLPLPPARKAYARITAWGTKSVECTPNPAEAKVLPVSPV
jgi:hypothetical protein